MKQNKSGTSNGLGKEFPIPNEELYTKKIVERFKEVLTKTYKAGETLRMFHPKIHGLVKAEFIVAPNLDEKYKVGIFKEANTYEAWIRLSNAKRKPSPDKKSDMRGFAIKVMGVKGEQLLEENKDNTTQDFLLVTSPILQTKSIKDFQEAIYALTGGFFGLLIFGITHIGTIIRSLKMVTKCANLLDHQYFSTVPFRFGPENSAVKYSVRPHKPSNSSNPNTENDNYLKAQLKRSLNGEPFVMEFLVQLQEDAVKQPIEDPRKEWSTPFVKLATINILDQKFDTKKQNTYAENLSFSPWHGIKEHKPLGGANRARKEVYKEMSTFRHEKNQTPEKEPSSWSDFPVKEYERVT